MALTTCEVVWLSQLLKELGIKSTAPVTLKCDNQAALAIAVNPVHHERTKHVEIDCHFIIDKVNQHVIKPEYVPTTLQLADILTKSLLWHNISNYWSRWELTLPYHLEGE